MKRYLSLFLFIINGLACTNLKNEIETLAIQCGVADSAEPHVRFLLGHNRPLTKDELMQVRDASNDHDLMGLVTSKACLPRSRFPAAGIRVLTKDKAAGGFFQSTSSSDLITDLNLHEISAVNIRASNCGTLQKNWDAFHIELESRTTLKGVRIKETLLNRQNEVLAQNETSILTDTLLKRHQLTKPETNMRDVQLLVTAEDLSGRPYSLDKPCSIQLDEEPPELSLQAPSLSESLSLLQGPLLVSANEPAIVYYRFHAEDSTDSCACGDVACGYQPLSHQPILWEEGQFKLSICGVDTAGNFSEPLSQSVLVDRSPPRVNVQWPESTNFGIRSKPDRSFTARIEASDSSGVRTYCRVGLLGPQNQWFSVKDATCTQGVCAGQSLSDFVPCEADFRFKMGVPSIAELAGQLLVTEIKAVDKAGHEALARATQILHWQAGGRVPFPSGQLPQKNIYELGLSGELLSGTSRTHSWLQVAGRSFVFDGLDWIATESWPAEFLSMSEKGEGLFQFLRHGKVRQWVNRTWRDVPFPPGESGIRDVFLIGDVLYILGEKAVWKREKNGDQDLAQEVSDALGLAFDEDNMFLLRKNALVNLNSGQSTATSVKNFWQSRKLGFYVQSSDALTNWRRGQTPSRLALSVDAAPIMLHDYGRLVIFLDRGQQIQAADHFRLLASAIVDPLNDTLIDPNGDQFQGNKGPRGTSLIVTRVDQSVQIFPGFEQGWIHQIVADDAGEVFYLGAEMITKASGDFTQSIPTSTTFGRIGREGLNPLGAFAWLFRDHQGRVWGLDDQGVALIDSETIQPLRLAGRDVRFADEFEASLTVSFADGIQVLTGSGSASYPMLSGDAPRGFFAGDANQLWALTRSTVRTWDKDRWIDQPVELDQPDSQTIYRGEDQGYWLMTRSQGGGFRYRFDPDSQSWRQHNFTSYSTALLRNGRLALMADSYMEGGSLSKPTAKGLELVAANSVYTFENDEFLQSTFRNYQPLGQLGQNLIFHITDAEGQSFLGIYGKDWQEKILSSFPAVRFFPGRDATYYQSGETWGQLVLKEDGQIQLQKLAAENLRSGTLQMIVSWNKTGRAIFHAEGLLYLIDAKGHSQTHRYVGKVRHVTSLGDGSLVFNTQDSWYHVSTKGLLTLVGRAPAFNSDDLEILSCQDNVLVFDKQQGSLLRIREQRLSTLRFDTESSKNDPLQLRKGKDDRIWVRGPSRAYVVHCVP